MMQEVCVLQFKKVVSYVISYGYFVVNSVVRDKPLKALLCLLVVTCSSSRLLHWELVDYPLAVCIYATPSAKFYSEHDLHADLVLIYLEGVGSCLSAEDCAARCASISMYFCPS